MVSFPVKTSPSWTAICPGGKRGCKRNRPTTIKGALRTWQWLAKKMGMIMIMPLMMVMVWDEVEDKDEDNLVTIVMVIGYDDCPHTHSSGWYPPRTKVGHGRRTLSTFCPSPHLLYYSLQWALCDICLSFILVTGGNWQQCSADLHKL